MPSRKSTLKEGMEAPDFSLPDAYGVMHQLSDYRGKYVLLYFYPKDDTPGCTAEACAFRDHNAVISENIQVLGISSDSVSSHKNFSEKFNLPFPILSDSDKEVIKSYGAAGIYTRRISYFIDPEGIIVKKYQKVEPAKHAKEIISDYAKISKKRK
jgi:thioredoxin-dependent peroxiredoxin